MRRAWSPGRAGTGSRWEADAAEGGAGGVKGPGGETVAVLGIGASGFAAARLALERGETVYVSDLRTDTDAAARAERLRELGARVELGAHDVARIAQAGLVVVSPGIPPDAPALRELHDRSVEWISEPELAARFYQGPLIAVTGTNGKTTTASLISHLLDSAGIDAALGGNVGEAMAPAASELALRDPPPAWYVLEVSSFQLAGTRRFSPDIGVVTTLAPDHLDRYPDADAYYADKARLFANATRESRWVLNGEVEAVRGLPGDAPGHRCFFAGNPDAAGAPEPFAFLRDGRLVLRLPSELDGSGSEEPLIARDELRLLGAHDVTNALAASLAARLAGADVDGIRRGLRSFAPLPHRMERVLERDDVLWVNDSKATNVEAARSAIESLSRPLVALLGGKDKGEDFRPLAPALRSRARLVLLYGEAARRLRMELQEGGIGEVPLVEVRRGFDAAVAAAARAARAGDAILLSPACSSFDAFSGYEERGRRFAELARAGGGR